MFLSAIKQGQVFIGQFENDTASLYSLNENQAREFYIPVYALLVNATTGEILPDPPTTPQVRISLLSSEI